MTVERKARPLAWIITIMVGVVAMCGLPAFFTYIDQRPGCVPFEPLLGHLPAVDVSVPLFVILYMSVGVVIAQLYRDPILLLRGFQAVFILLLLRMVAMFMVPLVPPPGLISLQDPCVQIFYPSSQPFEKDLFFSGHTANVFLFFLLVPAGKWKRALLVATVLVAMAVLVQHVHWTVDVLFAPIAAWLAWSASGLTIAWSLQVNGTTGSDHSAITG